MAAGGGCWQESSKVFGSKKENPKNERLFTLLCFVRARRAPEAAKAVNLC